MYHSCMLYQPFRYEDEWSNLFLNTGYGWNGYDLAWFSSNCIAEWVENDVVTSDRCDEATYVGKFKYTYNIYT